MLHEIIEHDDDEYISQDVFDETNKTDSLI